MHQILRRTLAAALLASLFATAAVVPAQAADSTGSTQTRPAAAASAAVAGSTRITLVRTNKGAHGYRIKARLFLDGAPYADRRLDLQVRRSGHWSSLHKVQRGNYRGVAVWIASRLVKNSYKFRVHFDGNPPAAPSNSRVFHLPRR